MRPRNILNSSLNGLKTFYTTPNKFWEFLRKNHSHNAISKIRLSEDVSPLSFYILMDIVATQGNYYDSVDSTIHILVNRNQFIIICT